MDVNKNYLWIGAVLLIGVFLFMPNLGLFASLGQIDRVDYSIYSESPTQIQYMVDWKAVYLVGFDITSANGLSGKCNVGDDISSSERGSGSYVSFPSSISNSAGKSFPVSYAFVAGNEIKDLSGSCLINKDSSNHALLECSFNGYFDCTHNRNGMGVCLKYDAVPSGYLLVKISKNPIPHETKIYLCQSPTSEWQWITSTSESDSSYGKWWCSDPSHNSYVLESTQQKTCANNPPFSCVFNTSGGSSSGGGSSSSSSSSSSSGSSSSSSSGGGDVSTGFLDIEFLGIKLWILLAGFVGVLLIFKKK